jgi:uncharacterized protein
MKPDKSSPKKTTKPAVLASRKQTVSTATQPETPPAPIAAKPNAPVSAPPAASAKPKATQAAAPVTPPTPVSTKASAPAVAKPAAPFVPKPIAPATPKTVAPIVTKPIAPTVIKPVAPTAPVPIAPLTPAVAAAPAPTPKAKTPRAPRKAPAKKPDLQVPPILLEGDKPSAPPTSGPGERYALGPTPPGKHAAAVETSGELPEAYGTGQLLLTARDPHWLYASWDLTRDQQRKYNTLSTDRHLVLRLFIGKVGGEPASQIHLHPESTHWFVPVDRADATYLAQLGYYQPGGKWVAVSTSEATTTPPDALSDDVTAQFATIPIEVPFSQLIELAKAAIREHIPLAEVLMQLRSRGIQVAESVGSKWTPEQERALGSIISMDRVRRVWMGSLEITELIQRRLQQEISSMVVSQFSLPTSPIGALGSVSSPFGAAERSKGFWFMVNAELIIYGATEPDAEVTIGGRVIKLRPDGSFSYRFALPDGAYELPAIAVSADKSEARAAELRFSRRTEFQGEVGVHPQDPQLKPPLAAHVA